MKEFDNLCMSCMTHGLNAGGTCSSCGADDGDVWVASHHLRPRTLLNGKYLVGRVIGEGGFGITYVGWDEQLSLKVAIKEYYPNGFVTRDSTSSSAVHSYSGEKGEFYNQGRDRFIEEARRLARFFGLPGIVAVKDFFTENGTAYIVMEFVEGATMRTVLSSMGGHMREEHVLEIMKPLIRSLAGMHKSGIIHRDIAPDNIMIQPDGSVKLLDFGAAREVATDGKSSAAIMKHGYAPEEQYDPNRTRQGPWTDVYAICATIFRAIEGDTPPDAIARLRKDTFNGFMTPVSENTRRVVMKGLAVAPEDRWQDIDELARELYPPMEAGFVPKTAPAMQTVPTPEPQPVSATEPVSVPPHEQKENQIDKTPEESAAKKTEKAKSGKILAAVVAGAVGLYMLNGLLPLPQDSQAADAPPASTQIQVSTPAPTATPASAPTLEETIIATSPGWENYTITVIGPELPQIAEALSSALSDTYQHTVDCIAIPNYSYVESVNSYAEAGILSDFVLAVQQYATGSFGFFGEELNESFSNSVPVMIQLAAVKNSGGPAEYSYWYVGLNVQSPYQAELQQMFKDLDDPNSDIRKTFEAYFESKNTSEAPEPQAGTSTYSTYEEVSSVPDFGEMFSLNLADDILVGTYDGQPLCDSMYSYWYSYSRKDVSADMITEYVNKLEDLGFVKDSLSIFAVADMQTYIKEKHVVTLDEDSDYFYIIASIMID